MRRILRRIVAVAAVPTLLGLAGCGQSGPLYLPAPPAKSPRRARPAPAQTAHPPSPATAVRKATGLK